MISRSSGLSVSREIQGGMGSKLSMLLVLIAAIVLIVTSEFGGGRLNHSNTSREEQQSQDKAVQEVHRSMWQGMLEDLVLKAVECIATWS